MEITISDKGSRIDNGIAKSLMKGERFRSFRLVSYVVNFAIAVYKKSSIKA